MRIALANMPFSSLQIPSIALHQLKEVAEEALPGVAEVSVHYLNHDFGAAAGPDIYAWISESLAGHTCGFGEWLFRQAAFPEAPDNTELYFRRYALHFGEEQIARYHRELAPIRARLPEIMDEMIDRHGLLAADLIGLTSMFFQNVPSFALARRLRDRGSTALILMGGANCEGTMGIEIVNHVPSIDFVFSGHALVSFPDFLRKAARGDVDALHRIDGVFSRRNSRSILTLEERPTRPGAARAEDQLDQVRVAAPERSLNQTVPLDYTRYLDSYETHFGSERADEIELLFETSRGCWWGEKAHCTFCGLNGATMSFREMGIEQARQSIEAMIDAYVDRGVSRFASVDNIIPRSYITDLLPHLSPPDHVTLFYEVKADLKPEDLKVLAAARVVEVQPGVESIATETLKLMRKGTNAFNNIRFLADCAAHGVKPVWNLLVGFPGESAETYEMYRRNLPRMSHLPPPSGVFPVRFDRFSPYFDHSDDWSLDLEPLDYHELIYPFDPAVISNMAYYFRDRNVEADYQTDLAQHLVELRRLVGDWRGKWQNAAGAPRLRLVEDAGGPLVEDSRAGPLVEHELNDADVALLRRIEAPRPADQVRGEFPDSYEYLIDLGLIFEERGRVMSLVFEGLRHEAGIVEAAFAGARGRAEAASLGLTF